LTPRLALRFGVLGMVAIGVFGVLFLRLWALQVLSGSQYLRAAQTNKQRPVRIQAPRGPILDEHGRLLVTNVAARAVQIWPSDLPKRKSARLHELRVLSRIVKVPVDQIAVSIRKHRNDPVTPVTVKDDAGDAQVLYLKERQDDFPGVQIANTYRRFYPRGSLAAHLLGYVSEISPQELKTMSKQGYRAGDKIGQAGVEATYDKFLRGQAGVARLVVDSLGRPRSNLVPTVAPQPGNALRLTIDLKLQQAAEEALQLGMADARA